MEWKAEEDIICCEVCVYEYVIKKNDTEIKTCIETIKKHASICRRGEGLHTAFKKGHWSVEKGTIGAQKRTA